MRTAVERQSNGDRTITIAATWNEPLGQLMRDYRYQPDLTQTLDRLGPEHFSQHVINDIVLWKVNRYVRLGEQSLAGLNLIASLKPGAHRDAREELAALLEESGVDLPMASTFLRFRNPKTFQIVDRHAYRALYGRPYPLYSSSTNAKKVNLYFSYLDDLFVLAESKHVPFEQLDRVLYIFDKQLNGRL